MNKKKIFSVVWAGRLDGDILQEQQALILVSIIVQFVVHSPDTLNVSRVEIRKDSEKKDSH